MPLKGDQLSLLSEVSSYPIENPPLLGEPITTRSGTAIVTRLEQLGEEVVIWGDYGSGVEQPHGRENATCDLKMVLGSRAVCQFSIADTSLTIDPLAPNFEDKGSGSTAEVPVRKTVLGGAVNLCLPTPVSKEAVGEYSAEPSSEETVLGGEGGNQASDFDPLAPKCGGRACGWIGWKTTERKRKRHDPWVCRQAWLYWEEPGGKKRSRYIPKAKLADVERSVYTLRRPIRETLELLGKTDEN